MSDFNRCFADAVSEIILSFIFDSQFRLINRRFIPKDVDVWYRQFVAKLKKVLIFPAKHEDLFQMLLNNADKDGKFRLQFAKNFFFQFFSVFSDLTDEELIAHTL